MLENALSKKEQLEEKFQNFKDQHTAENFNNINFLFEQAQVIRVNDEELADRILLRIQHLQKAQERNTKAQTKILSAGAASAEKVTQSENKIVQKQSSNNSLSKSTISGVEMDVSLKKIILAYLLKPFVLCVVIPALFFSFYQLIWATERYESVAKVIVQQTDSTTALDASMALLSGLGVSSTGGGDPELLEMYILSNDMLIFLDQELELKKYYQSTGTDVFSRLSDDAGQEDFLEYYQDHIIIEIDDKSSVITISAQGVDAEFAQKLTQKIVSRSEWYINNIGYQLAEAQLSFIKGEHQLNEDKFREAQSTLLAFQQKYHLLDPTAEALASQQITYEIEGKIALQETELKSLIGVMSESAPQVKAAKNNLEALRKQLSNERTKLSEDGGVVIPVSQIMSQYTNLKIAMELALQSYTSSTVSLEQSRIDAYRQLKYLITVQTATIPEKNAYPDVFYNISLFFILATMLFAIMRIVMSVIYELK